MLIFLLINSAKQLKLSPTIFYIQPTLTKTPLNTMLGGVFVIRLL